MSRSEAPCNSAENRDPTLADLVPHRRNACEWQKTHFAPAVNNSYSHVALYACPGGPDNHPVPRRRLKLISEGRLPNPWKFMIEIAISCDMSQFWNRMNRSDETKTRTLPTIDAKPQSENRQSVCRRSAKKQDPPHGQKTHRLAQTKPIVSTQSRGGPSAILFPCHFRRPPKLGRRAPIPKFTYCRDSRKISARSSDR